MVKKYSGLVLFFLGAGLLLVLLFTHITFINALLITPLALMLIGIFLHVWQQKRESRY